jgi:hypothetical protein
VYVFGHRWSPVMRGGGKGEKIVERVAAGGLHKIEQNRTLLHYIFIIF